MRDIAILNVIFPAIIAIYIHLHTVYYINCFIETFEHKCSDSNNFCDKYRFYRNQFYKIYQNDC